MRRSDGGVALLEVIAAVAILSTAGLGLVAVTSQAARVVRESGIRETELADEERLLTAYTLLTRPDLDLRLGTRETGDYVVEVQRPEAALYRIAIRRAVAPEFEDIVTVVYRPRLGVQSSDLP